MIQRHNEVVKQNDVVIFGGDLILTRKNKIEKLREYLNRMNGIKFLVRGNHDNETDEQYKEIGFTEVFEYIQIGKYFISHYPCYISKWIEQNENKQFSIIQKNKCELIIHGHIHNNDANLWESDGLKRQNICVDYSLNNFYPVDISYPEIVDFFGKII